METEPLQHLTEQSAGVGNWMLTVVSDSKEEEYRWTKGSASGTGRKIEYVLVSKDITQYCQGIYKKTGKEPTATQKLEEAKK